MRITHAGWFQMDGVHGTHHALWQLARAQARAGHDVSIVNLGWQVSPADVARARAEGVRLLGVDCPQWRGHRGDHEGRLARCIGALAPDVVHLQYVRIPRFAGFASVLRALRVPYVVSLHGGMKHAEMQRHRLRKLAYWRLVERAVHRGASGLHFVSEQERDEYRDDFGVAHAADAVVPNVVEPQGKACWKGVIRSDAPALVSLGRYDVWHKGLDLAAAMVRGLRRRGIQAALHLHGAAVGRFEAQMNRLRVEFADLPIVDGGVVAGPDKLARVAAHDLYLQYSRFELFGMALVEALSCGVPVALSERCDLARPLAAEDAAVVLPIDPDAAADVMAERLRDARGLADLAERGHGWWRRNCRADVVVDRMTQFYATALATAA